VVELGFAVRPAYFSGLRSEIGPKQKERRERKEKDFAIFLENANI
jgi:hypothetical protein